jgi:hypothetical protein
MAYLILRYHLNEGVSPSDFETWVKTVDQPAMRGLTRVTQFDTFRVTGLLMGEGVAEQSYVEFFEISDLDGFTSQDMASETVQSVMGTFMGFAKAPEFCIAEKL